MEHAAKKDQGVFTGPEWALSAICFTIALVTYWITAMPSIGLGDEGEMATAALKFGVMHPSGYPLWTILAGVFSLLHLGNGAWEMNIFSGLAAATSVGIFALMAVNSASWIGLSRVPATVVAMGCTLILSFTPPIWSQAVIGKGTYPLHVCMMMLLLLLCYIWLRRPEWKNAFVWVALVFCLAMSNHHMSLAMAALPLLVILLLHRNSFIEYAVYSMVVASILYLGFGYISDLHDVWKASVRLFYIAWTGLILLVVVKGKLTEWKRGLLLPIAVALGLAPYIYMPIASSTNPPMNWSDTKTKEGFFASINRTQYWGPLTEKLQGTVGKIVGVPPVKKDTEVNYVDTDTGHEKFLGFCKIFWRAAVGNLTVWPFLGVAGCFLFFRRITREQQIWVCLLVLGACLAGFLEPWMNPDRYDNYGWSVVKPWQGTFYAFFMLMASFGFASIAQYSITNRVKWLIVAIMPIAICIVFISSLPDSSQRGRWFGWQMGRDLLTPLPKGAIYMGGTDPGYFIAKYMVACESDEEKRFKRDPNFDRRDLFIMSQNMLGDGSYRGVLEAQYGKSRDLGATVMERSLGRPEAYPKDTIILPSHSEAMEVVSGMKASEQCIPGALSSEIAKWIFLNNKDKRRVFIEEQIPMPWSYKYAVPYGLCYELKSEPQSGLSEEVINADMKWWDSYIKMLKAQPGFCRDIVAQQAFAKQRNTGGNIYFNYKLFKAAEAAYWQELEICQDATSARTALAYIMADQGRYKEALDVADRGLKLDPENKILQKLHDLDVKRIQGLNELSATQEGWRENPKNMMLLHKAIETLVLLGRVKEEDALVDEAMTGNTVSVDALRGIIGIYSDQGNHEKAILLTEKILTIEPSFWKNEILMAKEQLAAGHKKEAISSLGEAVKLGGGKAKEEILNDKRWADFSRDNQFISAIQTN